MDSEFTNPDGPGRVNLYTAGYESIASYVSGAALPPADDLLGSVETLSQYDMVILSCHGESTALGYAQPTSQKEAAKAYVDSGGRMFGSHFYFSYLRGPPGSKNHFPTPFPDVATWDSDTGPTTFDIETGFPKGQAFAQWLVNVGASATLGAIELEGVEGSAASLLTPYTQSWISAPNTIPYFSMNMPIEKAATPDAQCGRFVHTGIHVAKGGNDPFPSGNANRQLTPQEKAFEFLIFDLSACPARFESPATLASRCGESSSWAFAGRATPATRARRRRPLYRDRMSGCPGCIGAASISPRRARTGRRRRWSADRWGRSSPSPARTGAPPAGRCDRSAPLRPDSAPCECRSSPSRSPFWATPDS